jgi:mRNA interferase RelE/StbE
VERSIVFTREAARQMDALAPAVRELIEAKLDLLAMKPTALANQIKRLKGSPALRLRVAGYRVVFTDDGMILEVIKVGARGGVYG